MNNRPSETNHVREAALAELDKLTQLLEADPDVIYAMSEEDVRSELQELGLDSQKVGPKMYTSDVETATAKKHVPSRSSSHRTRHTRERVCCHRDKGAEGEFYRGVFYLQALQRLRVDEAVRMAAKVEPFFWSDTPYIVVWLCHDCAAEVGLISKPAIVEEIRDRRA